MTAGPVADPTAEFEAQRGRLFGLAYRLLGSAADAEDVVQEAFLRWHGADRAAIGWPAAWLAKVVTNLCLNQLGSARAQREHYPGPWLPEPVLAGQRSRFSPPPADWRRLVERFLAAAGTGEVPGLERLLADEVTVWADGGGKVRAARRPVSGRDRVARYLAGALGRYGTGVSVALTEVNGEPAALAWEGTEFAGVLAARRHGRRVPPGRAPGPRAGSRAGDVRGVPRAPVRCRGAAVSAAGSAGPGSAPDRSGCRPARPVTQEPAATGAPGFHTGSPR